MVWSHYPGFSEKSYDCDFADNKKEKYRLKLCKEE